MVQHTSPGPVLAFDKMNRAVTDLSGLAPVQFDGIGVAQLAQQAGIAKPRDNHRFPTLLADNGTQALAIQMVIMVVTDQDQVDFG